MVHWISEINKKLSQSSGSIMKIILRKCNIIKSVVFPIFVTLLLFVILKSAEAGDPIGITTHTEDLKEVEISLNLAWILLCAFLVFNMQAGFAFLGAGFLQRKNTLNYLTMSYMDFCVRAIIFWIVGFALMFGGSGLAPGLDGGNKIIGYSGFFLCGECGCFITTETQKGHNYLRCTKRKNPCSQKYTREEIITSEIQKEIKKVSLPDDWAKWMLAENEKDKLVEAQSSTLFADNTKAEISLLDSKIKFILTRHEQGAAFMADVYGRLTGKVGVCLATLGPGATNLVTGVANANMDRSRLLAITGQKDSHLLHKESHQNMDAITMFKPITKWNWSIRNAKNIPEIVRRAFKIALSEKPGATHIELPQDIAKRKSNIPPITPQKIRRPKANEDLIKEAAEIIWCFSGSNSS